MISYSYDSFVRAESTGADAARETYSIAMTLHAMLSEADTIEEIARAHAEPGDECLPYAEAAKVADISGNFHRESAWIIFKQGIPEKIFWDHRAHEAAEQAEAAAQWAAVKARYNAEYFADKIFIIGEWHPVRPGYIVREARDVDGNNYVAVHKGNTPPTNPADYAVFDAAGKVVQRTVTPLPWGMTQQEHAASNAFASLPEAISAMCECSYSISQSLLPAILAGAETWEDVAAAVAKWEKDDAEAPFDSYGTPTVWISKDDYSMQYTTVSGITTVNIRLVSEFPGGPDIWEVVCEISSHNDFHSSSAMTSFAAQGWHCYNKEIRFHPELHWMDEPEKFREAFIQDAERENA